MDWILRSPQIHSTFSNLGYAHTDGYHINENCNEVLESIFHNILTEDKYLRTYRRNISFGQNIQKDLIPILINTKEDKTIELLIKILVNLTIPVECLLSVDVISKTDFGRHTVFEINNLLASTKTAFTDHRATRIVIEFLKKIAEVDQTEHLSPEVCININNCLLLLRNLLHIPEESSGLSPSYNGPNHTVQNQILWNIFSQSIDKILIKLMTIPDAAYWGVTMVQLIALLYKDQHVVTLHKLLNLWLEASLSDSSEDNESNTSPPDRGSEDSSPILTYDPTSDSSDTDGSGKSIDEPNSGKNDWNDSSVNNSSDSGKDQIFQPPPPVNKRKHIRKASTIRKKEEFADSEMNDQKYGDIKSQNENTSESQICSVAKKGVFSENSDCGYGTQIENQESISTSSNEDELPSKKPVHQKPHNPKQRPNTKVRIGITLQEKKRIKIVKRGKLNIINVQGLSRKTPTDDDISNILKEFTVDFLLKGYNSLVQTLHSQILTNFQLEIDTSHFFWLVTYFLKFATQIELDLKHVSSVLSFDILSYLTAEGVSLCEQFELAIKLDGINLKPSIRRLHLVVTAIREIVQAMEAYKKFSHICKGDHAALDELQIKMCETEELRSLMVLLLRHYNPKYHSKQYLQDLIVTNHILLMFLDSAMKLPDYKGSTNMLDHIRQFATPEVMHQYGLLLEDYAVNGVFVNDCIFTLMHHVGGELGSLISLFQPKILKTFTSIWQTEFEICDDWSDLIEYVINTFIKKPHALQSRANFRLETESFDELRVTDPVSPNQEGQEKKKSDDSIGDSSESRWNEQELSSLNWNYMQCKLLPDVIGEMVKLFKEDDVIKSRKSVLRELYEQNTITKAEYDSHMQTENEKTQKPAQIKNKEIPDNDIGKLCEQFVQDGKVAFLDWVQKVLLETCYVKINLDKKAFKNQYETTKEDVKISNFELFKKKGNELPVMSPVSYHSLLANESVPLVPWNCEQASICKDLKFLQLLQKLGFNMPVDTGKVFIRIPHFWSADLLYEVAGKISYLETSKLKFSLSELSIAGGMASTPEPGYHKPIALITAPDNFYQIHKQKHLATMVNFTPMPGPSYNSENCDLNGDGSQNWMDIIQKSQQYKIDCNVESTCETASVASDLTRMYVSDEDEKPEVLMPPVSTIEEPVIDELTSDSDVVMEKRPRVQFTLPL